MDKEHNLKTTSRWIPKSGPDSFEEFWIFCQVFEYQLLKKIYKSIVVAQNNYHQSGTWLVQGIEQ